ncbi:olfactory receptor 1500-like [Apodemus sylvaticus]|uniref:olfactory receptor 1500-like n=1 Tax=Apodemus sylvaticus TaxID=10129 RepID=UPI00224210BE|nr:olfactory receptor 1500-like [Apodemus sylvaticus]
MYCFLGKLSFSNLCFSSVTVHKLLQNIQSQDTSITYAGCLAQIYFSSLFGGLEVFFLVIRAYDCDVAICLTLNYIMSPKFCVCLGLLSWVFTIYNSMLNSLLLARLSFCKNNVICHFFYDISALLNLACSDIYINKLVIFILGGPIMVIPFLLIVVSYVHIIFSIQKVSSTQAIHKVFSTCGSHLSNGMIIGLYIWP